MYFLIFSTLALFAVGDLFFYQRAYKKFWFYVLSVILILFAATRSEVGIDWAAYENMFYHQHELISQNIEIGYSVINNFTEGMSFNFTLLVISSLSFLFLMAFINKFAYFKIIALLVYFTDMYFYLNLSGMRQGIALSITLFSIVFIYQKRFLLFCLSIFVACLFHKTAIFFGVAYFSQYIRLTYKNIIIFSFLAFFGSLLFRALTPIIETLGYFRDVSLYTDSNYNSSFSQIDFLIGTCKRLIPLLMLLSVSKLKGLQDNIIVKLYFVGLLCFLSLYPSFPDIAVRLSLYYLALDMIIYNFIFLNARSIYLKLFFIFILLLLGFYKIYGYANMNGYIYNNIF